MCSALSAAIADLAGIESRAVQVPAEFSGGEIRHHSVKRLRLVSVLPSLAPNHPDFVNSDFVNWYGMPQRVPKNGIKPRVLA